MSRLERMAPLTGALSVVIGTVAIGLSASGIEYLDQPSAIRAGLLEHGTRIEAGTWIGALSAVALLWFAGSVWKGLRALEGPGGRLSVVAFGGVVAAAGMLLLAYIAYGSAAARAGETGISEETAVALWDLGANLWGAGAPLAFAAAVGATAVIVLRHGGFPRWWGWASALLAVALIVLPISWIAFLAAHLWVLVFSVWLFIRETPID